MAAQHKVSPALPKGNRSNLSLAAAAAAVVLLLFIPVPLIFWNRLFVWPFSGC